MSDHHDIERIESCLNQLREHFDTVQIFVTRQDQDGTTTAATGVGNWMARYGQVRDWVDKEMEVSRVYARRKMEEER